MSPPQRLSQITELERLHGRVVPFGLFGIGMVFFMLLFTYFPRAGTPQPMTYSWASTLQDKLFSDASPYGPQQSDYTKIGLGELQVYLAWSSPTPLTLNPTFDAPNCQRSRWDDCAPSHINLHALEWTREIYKPGQSYDRCKPFQKPNTLVESAPLIPSTWPRGSWNGYGYTLTRSLDHRHYCLELLEP